MTEKGYEMERQGNLAKEVNKVNQDYEKTLNKAKSALKTFKKIKVDERATREEFEAARKKAIQTVEAFREVLKAKIAI